MTISLCPCGRTWTGTTSAHCGCCHEHFSTVKNFDAHKPKRLRSGAVACGKPEEMTRTKQDATVVPLFKAVHGAHGVTWVGWTEESPYAGRDEDGADLLTPLADAR